MAILCLHMPSSRLSALSDVGRLMQDDLQTRCLLDGSLGMCSPNPHFSCPRMLHLVTTKSHHNNSSLLTPALQRLLLQTDMHSALCAGKKRGPNAKAGSRSPASPKQSAGSGSASKARGGKQAGRRRSRESLNQATSSAEAGPQEEDDDEPSAKRSVRQHLLCRACHNLGFKQRHSSVTFQCVQ